MVARGKAILFGVLIWAIAFAVAVAIFPFRESWRALFESIMPVTIALATVAFALLYFKRVEHDFVREGVALGIVWFAINVLVDLPLMLSGPIAMTLAEYFADIGLTYLMIPAITIGMGIAAERVAVRTQSLP